jgi:hypothetical protein
LGVDPTFLVVKLAGSASLVTDQLFPKLRFHYTTNMGDIAALVGGKSL